MQDKALFIIIAMYGLSFAFLFTQYLFLDPFHIEITDIHGNSIRSNVTQTLNVDSLNTISRAIIQTDFSNPVSLAISAAFVIWQLLLILSGSLIFNLLAIFGIPAMIVVSFQILYIILLAVFIIRALRPQP